MSTLDDYTQGWNAWQRRIAEQLMPEPETNPLDEILEAAGIPQDTPERFLARRDTHNVVGPKRSSWRARHYLLPPGASYHQADRGELDIGILADPIGHTASLVIIDDPIKSDNDSTNEPWPEFATFIDEHGKRTEVKVQAAQVHYTLGDT